MVKAHSPPSPEIPPVTAHTSLPELSRMDAQQQSLYRAMTPRQRRAYLARLPKRPPVHHTSKLSADPDRDNAEEIHALRKQCLCINCHLTRWPFYYVKRRWSYECILEANAPTDHQHYEGLVSTSESPSAWAMEHARLSGARPEKTLRMAPEDDAALMREIAKISGNRKPKYAI